ncbi:MAG TPA: hypothetical protein DDY91_16495 [Planctomycetaceae bacterium]|nr:hypothetical protein [Planctomycetaceae bacterium]
MAAEAGRSTGRIRQDGLAWGGTLLARVDGNPCRACHVGTGAPSVPGAILRPIENSGLARLANPELPTFRDLRANLPHTGHT